jgi:hypothetical protein
MTALHSLLAWCGPALVTGVAWQVFTGEPLAPLLVLGVALAPLLVVLARAPGHVEPDLAVALPTLAALALVLRADMLAVADLGRAYGVSRLVVIALATLVLVALLHRRAARTAAHVLGSAGLVALAVALAGLAVSAAAPWTAWARVASQGAFEFAARSPAVTRGETIADPVTLTFSEPHRITAATAGVFRVVEHDGDRLVVRDWRLAPGDPLGLRTGDQLVLPAGATVRFEPGKRVPGVAMSGVGWADPRRRPTLGALTLVGPLVTFVGGALAVVGGARPATLLAVIAGPTVAVAGALGAALWGVYGALRAPELVLAGSPASLLVQGPAFVVGGEAGRGLQMLATGGLVALFLGAALALRARMSDLAALWLVAPARVSVAWLAVVAMAALASIAPSDPWRALLLGLGLGAASLLAPMVFAATPLERRIGALVGASVFVVLASAARILGGAEAVYPAVAAAPASALGVMVARLRRD